MGTYRFLDYFKWTKEMDLISWDKHSNDNTPWSFTAMSRNLMRGLKDASFMLMSSSQPAELEP